MWRLLLLSAALAACSSSPSQGDAWLPESSILVSGPDTPAADCRSTVCRHNENTDLVTWQDAIYLVHRTATSQILGPNSSLRLYRSTDSGATFEHLAIIPAPVDRDLRDPHFYVVGNELWIKALTRLPVISDRDSNVDTIAVVTRSADGSTWTDLEQLGPATWSFWRIREHDGVYYSAAYHDGDSEVVLFSSSDGLTWTAGATVYGVAEDTPLETELVFMPSGRLLALVRMDGTDEELLGDTGRLRTKVCWAAAPYDSFDCPQEFGGYRLDGPLAFFEGQRLFVVARKHLQPTGRKRTAIFEITGTFEDGPLDIAELGELPSAGDTSYAGAATLGADRVLVSWYSGVIADDLEWLSGMLAPTDIWIGTIDTGKLQLTR